MTRDSIPALRAFTIRTRHAETWRPTFGAWRAYVILVAKQHWGECAVDAFTLEDGIRYQRAPAIPTHEIEQTRYA